MQPGRIPDSAAFPFQQVMIVMMQVDVNRRQSGLQSTEISTLDSQIMEKILRGGGGEAFRLKGFHHLGSSTFPAC